MAIIRDKIKFFKILQSFKFQMITKDPCKIKKIQNVAKTKSQVSENNALPTITTNAQILNDNDMCVNGVKIINDASSKLMTHHENVNVGDEQGQMFCNKTEKSFSN
jgi:hypothetical protein